jgi:hypothetical protein
VISPRAIVSSTDTGSKRGRITDRAPTHVQAKTLDVPATWNIGHTCSQRSARAWPVTARLCSALESRLRWESITPLGVPVVPPV